MARSTAHNGLDPLDIGLPGTIGTSVGVGDLNTKGNALATKITLRHFLHLLSASWRTKIAPSTKRFDMITKFLRKSKCFFAKILVFSK